MSELEKQYPTFEQAKRKSELGMKQDDCLAVWFKHYSDDCKYDLMQIQYFNCLSHNGLSKALLDEGGDPPAPEYKAFTITQMEQFVFDCKDWVGFSKAEIGFGTVSSNMFFSDTVYRSKKDGSFVLPNMDIKEQFPTLSQAWAAVCIFILENFKPPQTNE